VRHPGGNERKKVESGKSGEGGRRRLRLFELPAALVGHLTLAPDFVRQPGQWAAGKVPDTCRSPEGRAKPLRGPLRDSGQRIAEAQPALGRPKEMHGRAYLVLARSLIRRARGDPCRASRRPGPPLPLWARPPGAPLHRSTSRTRGTHPHAFQNPLINPINKTLALTLIFVGGFGQRATRLTDASTERRSPRPVRVKLKMSFRSEVTVFWLTVRIPL
jgi:hypothetical protein